MEDVADFETRGQEMLFLYIGLWLFVVLFIAFMAALFIANGKINEYLSSLEGGLRAVYLLTLDEKELMKEPLSDQIFVWYMKNPLWAPRMDWTSRLEASKRDSPPEKPEDLPTFKEYKTWQAERSDLKTWEEYKAWKAEKTKIEKMERPAIWRGEKVDLGRAEKSESSERGNLTWGAQRELKDWRGKKDGANDGDAEHGR